MNHAISRRDHDHPSAGIRRLPHWSAEVMAMRRVQASLTLIGFLALFAVFAAWLGTTFVDIDARMLDIHQNAPIYLLALAAMTTLAAGQFDLSIASMATLTSFTTIQLHTSVGLPFWAAIVGSLLIGAVGGLVNAFLVVKVEVHAFIATLGTSGVFAGIASVTSGGTQVVAPVDEPLPQWFTGPGSLGDFNEHFPEPVLWLALALALVAMARWLRLLRPAKVARTVWDVLVVVAAVVVALVLVFAVHIRDVLAATSWTTGILLVVTAVLWLLMEYTVTGRSTYAVGDNAEASRLAGVKVERTTTKAFVTGGVLAAAAGIVFVANQGVATPNGGATFLLPAFAAAFLSTVLFSTGRFNVWGSLLGGIFLQWVGQGLIVGGVPFTWTEVVNGTVLVLAVAFATTLKRRGRR